MIETFKILKSFDRVGGQEGFLKLNTRHQGTALSLRNPPHQEKEYILFIKNYQWVEQSAGRGNSRSINSFKNRFDRHVQNVTRRGISYEP